MILLSAQLFLQIYIFIEKKNKETECEFVKSEGAQESIPTLFVLPARQAT